MRTNVSHKNVSQSVHTEKRGETLTGNNATTSCNIVVKPLFLFLFQCQLEDGLLQEAEKLLCQLICYAGEKKLRLQFVKGCIDNLAQNKYVALEICAMS